MLDFDIINIEISRTQREAYALVHEKLAATQLGECFHDVNHSPAFELRDRELVLDRGHEKNGHFR